jgi:hypothetical protein
MGCADQAAFSSVEAPPFVEVAAAHAELTVGEFVELG